VLSQSSAVPRVATKTGVCRSLERPTPSEPLSSGFRCAGTRKPVTTRSVRRRCRAPSSWLHRRGSPTWREHAGSLTDTCDSSRKHRARFSRDASSLPSSETLLQQPHAADRNSSREGSAPPQAPTPEARTSIFPSFRAYALGELTRTTIRSQARLSAVPPTPLAAREYRSHARELLRRCSFRCAIRRARALARMCARARDCVTLAPILSPI